MNLKNIQSNFAPVLHVFEHQGENCLGLFQPPFGELGLKTSLQMFNILTYIHFLNDAILNFKFELFQVNESFCAFFSKYCYMRIYDSS